MYCQLYLKMNEESFPKSRKNIHEDMLVLPDDTHKYSVKAKSPRSGGDFSKAFFEFFRQDWYSL